MSGARVPIFSICRTFTELCALVSQAATTKQNHKSSKQGGGNSGGGGDILNTCSCTWRFLQRKHLDETDRLTRGAQERILYGDNDRDLEGSSVHVTLVGHLLSAVIGKCRSRRYFAGTGDDEGEDEDEIDTESEDDADSEKEEEKKDGRDKKKKRRTVSDVSGLPSIVTTP